MMMARLARNDNTRPRINASIPAMMTRIPIRPETPNAAPYMINAATAKSNTETEMEAQKRRVHRVGRRTSWSGSAR